uniref:Uncharacterized protein n=1 Tax=Aquila chrysaetos chrysaetos TaxID=223781 RepID=A0A663EU30_AQUCH
WDCKHVQLGQLGIGRLNVVQVLDGFPEGGEHFPAMGADLGVAKDGGGAGEVPEGSEEPLGPGVDDQQPGEGWRGNTSRHRDVNAPQCNCHSFSVQGAAEQMPGSWTYLARASAPHSSTLILLQIHWGLPSSMDHLLLSVFLAFYRKYRNGRKIN